VFCFDTFSTCSFLWEVGKTLTANGLGLHDGCHGASLCGQSTLATDVGRCQVAVGAHRPWDLYAVKALGALCTSAIATASSNLLKSTQGKYCYVQCTCVYVNQKK
jgi:hypothetical protein